MQSTTIYLEPKQLKELRKRAKQQESTFSEQVRNAIDRYLTSGESEYSEEELAALIKQADKSIKNMGRRLDSTNSFMETILPRIERNVERI